MTAVVIKPCADGWNGIYQILRMRKGLFSGMFSDFDKSEGVENLFYEMVMDLTSYKGSIQIHSVAV